MHLFVFKVRHFQYLGIASLRLQARVHKINLFSKSCLLFCTLNYIILSPLLQFLILQKQEFDNLNSQMEQIQKGPKSYQINDNILNLGYGVRKHLKLPKNLQAMVQPIDNKCRKTFSKPQITQNLDIPIPYQMSETFIKYMLFYRIEAFLTGFSILLSVIEVYVRPYQTTLVLVGNALTISIFVAIAIKFTLFINHIHSKKQNVGYTTILNLLTQITLVCPHPTIWTLDHNHYLHLAIMLRIYIIIKFLIQSSIYCSVRAYRIININGLNASQHFLFAVKSLVQSLNFAQILAIEMCSMLYFTHCLYLVGIDSEGYLDILDCFQVVMVMMPTVGFGEYYMPFLGQKIILVFTVVNGAVLNSFVTLSMLKQLQMNPNQLSSYWLMKKIQARQHIQNISKNYIQKSFSIIRQKAKQGSQNKQHINFSFKNEYRVRKSLYNSISYTDINNLFSFYRDRLIQFKISTLQTANMVSTLLRSFHRHNLQKGSPGPN